MDPRHNQPPFLDKRSILTSLEDHSNVALDLGCGVDKLPHAIGIDSTDAPSVDVVGDVLVVLRSLPDASVDHIYTRHFLEHVPDLMGILQECVRVLRPGGEL